MTPHRESGNSSVWHFEQDENDSRTYVGPQPNSFVHWLYHGVDADGKPFSSSSKLKYMKKYGLDKDYDLNTGFPLKKEEEKEVKDEDVPEQQEKVKEDKTKTLAEDLRKKFMSGEWKEEALKMKVEPKESVDKYLDTVREFIKQQEEFDLHGLALYGINEERTRAHEDMLKDYGLDGTDEKSNVARDITKRFDFSGECKLVNGHMKTVFFSEYEASLRLAYALEKVISI